MLGNYGPIILVVGFDGGLDGSSNGVYFGGLVVRPGGKHHFQYRTYHKTEKISHSARFYIQTIFYLDLKKR